MLKTAAPLSHLDVTEFRSISHDVRVSPCVRCSTTVDPVVRREAAIVDMPMDTLVDSLIGFISWVSVAHLAQTCRGLHTATSSKSQIPRQLLKGLQLWRATARATRTAWQTFCSWRWEASRLREDAYDASMMEELEAMMSEEESSGADLTDEEAEFLEHQMMKQSWEQLARLLL